MAVVTAVTALTALLANQPISQLTAVIETWTWNVQSAWRTGTRRLGCCHWWNVLLATIASTPLASIAGSARRQPSGWQLASQRVIASAHIASPPSDAAPCLALYCVGMAWVTKEFLCAH
mmetsp:Transcript_24967/g.50174  ORF Transcript_24967/g.50174 Transcript_24967/m.50174 type:complete len:119 (+) Transcript_24967:392-748(+)